MIFEKKKALTYIIRVLQNLGKKSKMKVKDPSN